MSIAQHTGLTNEQVETILYEAAGHYIDFLETGDQWHLGRHTGMLRVLVLLGASNDAVIGTCNKFITAQQQQ